MSYQHHRQGKGQSSFCNGSFKWSLIAQQGRLGKESLVKRVTSRLKIYPWSQLRLANVLATGLANILANVLCQTVIKFSVWARLRQFGNYIKMEHMSYMAAVHNGTCLCKYTGHRQLPDWKHWFYHRHLPRIRENCLRRQTHASVHRYYNDRTLTWPGCQATIQFCGQYIHYYRDQEPLGDHQGIPKCACYLHH